MNVANDWFCHMCNYPLYEHTDTKCPTPYTTDVTWYSAKLAYSYKMNTFTILAFTSLDKLLLAINALR